MPIRVEYKTVCKTMKDGTTKCYYYDKITGKPIKGLPGSSAFVASLRKLRAERGEVQWAKGTIDSLMHQYQRSEHWKSLAPNTQTNYRAGLTALVGMEHVPLKELRKVHLIRIRDGMRDRPGIANQTLGAISAMITWAKESDAEEWHDIEYNVVDAVKRLKLGTWKPWPDTAIEKFEAADLTRQARLAFSLLLYTAQRRGDVLKMRWSDYNPAAFGGLGSIRVVQEKTAETEDDYLEIAVHPHLKAVLDAEKPNTKSVFIVHREDGRPYWSDNHRAGLTQAILFAEHFQSCQEKVFGKGKHYPIHGLRKAAANRLAEAGCSTQEIMAITGHATLAMVELYTKRADQKRRSVSAMKKLVEAG